MFTWVWVNQKDEIDNYFLSIPVTRSLMSLFVAFIEFRSAFAMFYFFHEERAKPNLWELKTNLLVIFRDEEHTAAWEVTVLWFLLPCFDSEVRDLGTSLCVTIDSGRLAGRLQFGFNTKIFQLRLCGLLVLLVFVVFFSCDAIFTSKFKSFMAKEGSR